MAGDGHIRVAVGRDYADVPPTRGVFKGEAPSAANWRWPCAWVGAWQSSLRAVGALHRDVPLVIALVQNADRPGIAAHLAVLDERPGDVGLDVDVHLLAAVRADHGEVTGSAHVSKTSGHT